jgi:hypothetical protein
MKGIYAQKSLPEVNESGTSEHDLWVAVLSKAAHDAIYASDWNESRQAISWFKTGGFNFRTVCGYAGRDASYVHRAMELPIKRREAHMSMIRSGNWKESGHDDYGEPLYQGIGTGKRGRPRKEVKNL